MSVTVTGDSTRGVPTGRVRLDLGSATCNASLSGTAVDTAGGGCDLSGLGGGAGQTLTALYLPSGGLYAGSSDTQTVTVNPAATTTALASSANPATVGAAVTLTATVTSAAGTPGGNVTLSIDGTPQVLALSGGAASVTRADLGLGNHTVTASYAGTGDYLRSGDGPLTQTIEQGATSVTVTPPTPAPVAGEPIDVGVTVTGEGTPGGDVTVGAGGGRAATSPSPAAPTACWSP